MIESSWDGFLVEYIPEPPMVTAPGTFKGTPQEVRAIVLQQIEEHPDNFSMDGWAENNDHWAMEGYSTIRIDAVKALDGDTMCETTLCIAGYAQLIVRGKITKNVANDAQHLLGLENDSLFFMTNEDARAKLRDLVEQDKKANA
jgi:hypothetical protein